jgi:hypothetical protein
MPIDPLFNRDFAMTVAGAPISIQKVNTTTGDITAALRVVFSIEKSDNRDPNRATVVIYNLSEPNRKILQIGSEAAEKSRALGLVYDWPLVIEAGYALTRSQIFSGDIVRADSRIEGTEWVTTIEAQDGGNKYRSARISQSFAKGTPLVAVLNTLAAALGVGFGNSAAHFAASPRGLTVFENGLAVNGRVSKLLDKYITSAGYNWSIQDGQLQVLAPNETLLDAVVVLSPLTGLVGSPDKGEKGIIKTRSLLQPQIIPGRLVTMLSKSINGGYKATKVSHFGDTWGQDWYTEFEGKPMA